MKRLVPTLLLIVFLFSVGHYAAAEDLSTMKDDELLDLRLQINNELANRLTTAEVPDGSTIADLFPDPVFARYVRDQIGAFSTKDLADPSLLEGIREVNFLSHDDGLTSLEGIQYLPNLEGLWLYWQDGLKEIPDAIGDLIYLKTISLTRCEIAALPDSITNLVNLETLRIDQTNIAELPEDIGNLTSLTYLDISETKITELPKSIYNLTLSKFLRNGLDLD